MWILRCGKQRISIDERFHSLEEFKILFFVIWIYYMGRPVSQGIAANKGLLKTKNPFLRGSRFCQLDFLRNDLWSQQTVSRSHWIQTIATPKIKVAISSFSWLYAHEANIEWPITILIGKTSSSGKVQYLNQLFCLFFSCGVEEQFDQFIGDVSFLFSRLPWRLGLTFSLVPSEEVYRIIAPYKWA